MINIVGVEFLINFGGLGQLINELAERYDLPGTYAAIASWSLPASLFFDVTARLERCMRPHRDDERSPHAGVRDGRIDVRAASTLVAHCASLVAVVLVAWEIVSLAGLALHDIVPSLAKIGVALSAAGDNSPISGPISASRRAKSASPW